MMVILVCADVQPLVGRCYEPDYCPTSIVFECTIYI